jgi:uncharacterized protein YndB with AHSA1/START domain
MSEQTHSAEDATMVEPGVVRFERLLPASIDRVWAYLADDDLRATWLAGGSIDKRIGGVIDLDMQHARITAEPIPAGGGYEDHHELGTIVAWEPPHVLSYTWGEWFGQSCIVRFELSRVGDDTRMILTHSRIEKQGLNVDVAAGWHGHLDALEDKIAGGTGVGFWDNFDRHRDHYASRLL